MNILLLLPVVIVVVARGNVDAKIGCYPDRLQQRAQTRRQDFSFDGKIINMDRQALGPSSEVVSEPAPSGAGGTA